MNVLSRLPGMKLHVLRQISSVVVANMNKSILQGGLPEIALSSTTFLHPGLSRHDQHMPAASDPWDH